MFLSEGRRCHWLLDQNIISGHTLYEGLLNVNWSSTWASFRLSRRHINHTCIILLFHGSLYGLSQDFIDSPVAIFAILTFIFATGHCQNNWVVLVKRLLDSFQWVNSLLQTNRRTNSFIAICISTVPAMRLIKLVGTARVAHLSLLFHELVVGRVYQL